MKRGNLLTGFILLALLLGVIVGQLLYENYGANDPSSVQILKDAGDLILIRPLMLMIVPLIFVSVVVAVTSLGDPSKLGLIGGSTILYYFSTMLLAVVLGTTLVATFKPGAGIDPEVAASLRAEGEQRLQGEAELTQRMAEAQEEWEAKEEELNAITRRALTRAKMAERSARQARPPQSSSSSGDDSRR